MDEPDPELPAGPEQPGIDEGRAVVDVCGSGDAAGGQRGFQRGGQPDGVLGEPEPVTHRQPAVVVQEREQIHLPAGDLRAVQGVADPPLVRCVGLEPAEHHRLPGGRAHQLEAVEVPQQGGFRRRPPGRRPQDPHHLGGGPAGVLPLQRRGQLEHLRVDPGAGLPDRRGQRVEPAGPVTPDPPIQGVPRIPDLTTERAVMAAAGDAADELAALLRRQPRLQRRADQLIPEQRDLLRPLPAFHRVLIERVHHVA